MNYTDADGNFAGFDTELARAVCEKLGVEPELQEIIWETKEVERAIAGHGVCQGQVQNSGVGGAGFDFHQVF